MGRICCVVQVIVYDWFYVETGPDRRLNLPGFLEDSLQRLERGSAVLRLPSDFRAPALFALQISWVVQRHQFLRSVAIQWSKDTG